MRPTLKGTLVAASTVAATAGVLIANPAAPATPPGQTSTASAGTGVTSPSTVDVEQIAAESSDGTYTGDTIQTRYGPMQVQATISAGALTDIRWLQISDDPHSRQINDVAGPALVEESLASQSAQVSTITGATYTSTGFRQSLQSILDEAGL